MELSLKRHTSQISPTLPFSDTRVSGLAFDHSKFFKEIGAGDIGKAYTCKVLDSSTSYYYAMKVVNKKNLALKGNRFYLCQVETLKAANWLFVVESVKIRSSSTVDTHKYISPEMAKDKSHGNKMD
ncbi:hypothetical protein G4B88_017880 [Cannabis sativa]|uniref:non-specific serine/threonine protein kinase n=1 Tax=Cannabis sativa TaxID=3483 RepID=A0A7J6DNP4_CANSA|nr:hypothetical protein G4B88_017880 [Cannabis sativa]